METCQQSTGQFFLPENGTEMQAIKYTHRPLQAALPMSGLRRVIRPIQMSAR